MRYKTFKGKLYEGDFGEDWDVLYLEGGENPLLVEVLEFISNKKFPFNEERVEKQIKELRYAISDKPISNIEEIIQDVMLYVDGVLELEYDQRFSEITGYLWTDEELNIGGHNLLNELKKEVGRYLYLEIGVEE